MRNITIIISILKNASTKPKEILRLERKILQTQLRLGGFVKYMAVFAYQNLCRSVMLEVIEKEIWCSYNSPYSVTVYIDWFSSLQLNGPKQFIYTRRRNNLVIAWKAIAIFICNLLWRVNAIFAAKDWLTISNFIEYLLLSNKMFSVETNFKIHFKFWCEM